MSKAVTNEEVEDVLSSIRRLVSEDKRPLAGLRAAPPAASQSPPSPDVADQDAVSGSRAASQSDYAPRVETKKVMQGNAADRLVLTPALRVAGEPERLAGVTSTEPEFNSAPVPQQERPEEGPLDLGSVARETWTSEEAAPEVGSDEVTVADAKAYKGPMVLFPAAQQSVSEDERDAAMEALDALVHDAVEADAKSDIPEVNEPSETEEPLEDGDYSDECYWSDDESDAHDTDDDEDDADTEPTYRHTVESGIQLSGSYAWNEEEVLADRINPPLSSDDRVTQISQVGPSAQSALGDDVIEEYDDDQLVKAGNVSSADMDANAEEAVQHGRSGMRSASVTQIPLTAKIAALEAAIGKIATGWEPDGDERDELAVPDAPAMAWEDDVELDARGAPFVEKTVAPEDIEPEEKDTSAADAPQTEAPQQTGAGFGVDDQVMDEEALRDLVAEIVRSELQGALGERITRNVRKLVRREIHRALTAHEME